VYLIRGGIRVSWVELGEGWNGDYNSEDLNDEELLRFDIHVKKNGNWEPVEDASYCTRFPVSATFDQKADALIRIMNAAQGPLLEGRSIKKLCEELSWINPAWVGGEYRV